MIGFRTKSACNESALGAWPRSNLAKVVSGSKHGQTGMIEEIILPIAVNATKLVEDGAARSSLTAAERFLQEFAPKGIADITTLSGHVIKPGYSARMVSADFGFDFTVRLTSQGKASISSAVSGFILHGGEASSFGKYGYDNLSKFEQMRRMIPLKVGKEVPLGTEGDWIFKPVQNKGVAPIRVERIPGPETAHHLIIRESWLYTVRELSDRAGLLSRTCSYLGWHLKLLDGLRINI